MKKFILMLILSFFIFILTSCDSVNVEVVDFSETLNVRKIENIDTDFIMGMDASSVISLENAGVKYYNYNGEEQDVFLTLAQSGINYIRVRVWNDPFDDNGNGYGGGNCDIETAVKIGKRATKYGMKLLVDFHYSDFWADPGKQKAPKAWLNMGIDEKAESLYDYTYESLKKLKSAGVDVGMVQIGNETNGAMCGEKNWANIAKLMIEGSKAVRKVYKKALVAVHFANPEKITHYYDYAKNLEYYGVDYDVFGSSYYPYWHGTLANLAKVLNNITDTYDKKVMVLETSYAYTAIDSDFHTNTISSYSSVTKNYPYTVQGQADSLIDVIDCVANDMKNGIGVCYWEGTWIATGGKTWEANSVLWNKYGTGWATKYASQYDPNDAGKYYGGNAVDNQAMFDKNGYPLESLKTFSLVKKGNIIE